MDSFFYLAHSQFYRNFNCLKFNKTEKDERDSLARVIEKLEYAIKSIDKMFIVF